MPAGAHGAAPHGVAVERGSSGPRRVRGARGGPRGVTARAVDRAVVARGAVRLAGASPRAAVSTIPRRPSGIRDADTAIPGVTRGPRIATLGAMIRLLASVAFVVAAGCAAEQTSSTSPQITGDTCALHADATTCAGDATCTWLGTGCACPPNSPDCTCPDGACVSTTGQGSSSGSGSTGAACACPNGDVCFEQIGGTAQSSDAPPPIACTTPASGTGDPCPRIVGEGTCHASTAVSGLCLCDNGIR